LKPFTYQRAEDLHKAVDALAYSPETHILGGGTNLIDLMKCGVTAPSKLVDIARLNFDDILALPGGGVRIGATARNSDTANHVLIRRNYPLLSQAILSGASPQLRNMATAGGNLLQRTRCPYFMDTGFSACNKRIPGSGCGAIAGVHRNHAIFGISDSCIATHPSDMCVALAALDAVVVATGPSGERQIPFDQFHSLPGNSPHLDTSLQPGEIIVAIDLPPPALHRRSHYVKVRERTSFAFALVSVAAGLKIEGRTIRVARIALGGVAHKPWRAYEAERELVGATADEETFQKAGALAARGARPHRDNAFKVSLVQKATKRALLLASGAA
jgi:xanthine dehydrogenase YagS FAD-binding subunit